jgi:hypothetical protein
VKTLGFVIIAIGLIMVYIGITGSQHAVASIVFNSAQRPGGKNINPSGPAGGGTTTTSQTGSSGDGGSGSTGTAV